MIDVTKVSTNFFCMNMKLAKQNSKFCTVKVFNNFDSDFVGLSVAPVPAT